MGDRSTVDVHAYDASSDPRKDGGTVSLAGRDVEDVDTLTEVTGQTVLMEVLELDLTGYRRCHALTDEFHRLAGE